MWEQARQDEGGGGTAAFGVAKSKRSPKHMGKTSHLEGPIDVLQFGWVVFFVSTPSKKRKD